MKNHGVGSQADQGAGAGEEEGKILHKICRDRPSPYFRRSQSVSSDDSDDCVRNKEY